MTNDDVLEVSVHIEARREAVFRYFTDPDRYVQWMGSDATIEAVAGGVYRVRMRDGVEAAGQFIDIEEPRRIVFTWGWTSDEVVTPGSTRVEVTLTEDPSGTTVVLRHFGLPSDEQREQHGKGWELYLNRLAARATGRNPGPDPNAEIQE
jgi:uncharacterized protein YndB with AHSA1/START domain